jgi:hypothetical protein
MLAVDYLLRVNAPVREEPPDNVDPSLLLNVTVGWSVFVTMIASLGLAFMPGIPDILNALGALSFWVGSFLVATVRGRRRVRRLPPDLRPMARNAINASTVGVRPVRWWWIFRSLLVFFIGVPLTLLAVGVIVSLVRALV